MNWFDIFLLSPLIWGLIRGYYKGLVSELISIGGMIAGLYAGIYLSYIITPYVQEKVNNTFAYIVAFILTFILAVVGLRVLGKFLEKLINYIELDSINKIAGAILGMLKYLIITSCILFFAVKIGLFKSHVQENPSAITKFYTKSANYIIPIFEDIKLKNIHPIYKD